MDRVWKFFNKKKKVIKSDARWRWPGRTQPESTFQERLQPENEIENEKEKKMIE